MEEKTTQEPMNESIQGEQPETTQETTPEQPGTEVSSDEVKQQLAQEVKDCVIEGKSCKGLGSKLDEVAKELGIGFVELIDQVFKLIDREEG